MGKMITAHEHAQLHALSTDHLRKAAYFDQHQSSAMRNNPDLVTLQTLLVELSSDEQNIPNNKTYSNTDLKMLPGSCIPLKAVNN